MKIVLACLMCVVLTASECFAISGGPVFNTGINVVGTYAGVIKPSRFCDVCDNGQDVRVKCKDVQSYVADHPGATAEPCIPPSVPDCSLNSLGVFSIGVPSAGIATGDFVMFAQGRVFTGNIQGTADPNTAKLTGILTATFDFTVTDPATGDTTDVTASANGNLKTTISNTSSQGVTTGIRLSGTATLAIDQGLVNLGDLTPILDCQAIFRVNGFKQSNTATASTGTSG
jgi:hypothetical protein